jgi:eukaryotic-like serine/threonine-protein kinase
MKTCPHCETGYPDSQTTCPTHGDLLKKIRELEPGMVIHKTYRIVRKLGQGGMGTVYLAEHILLREQRVLKFLAPELNHDPRFVSRFAREARAMHQLRCRNVAEYGDLEVAEDNSLFYSMELVDGPSLRRFLDSEPKPFDVQLALTITRGIAEGLGAAHAKGMVHRDINPGNILLAQENDGMIPKIIGFRIVATEDNSSVDTRNPGLVFDPPYAAPEQWRGMPAAELDGRTDFYALGGVLFEMLTGQTPFQAGNLEGYMLGHLTEAPQPPSGLRPELAEWKGLDELVLRLLAKDRDDRPRDAEETLKLIEAIGAARPRTTEFQ